LASALPAHLCHLFSPRRVIYPSVFVDNLQNKLGRRSGEEIKLALLTMAYLLELIESLRWILVGMYLCITGRICLLLVFHVHIHHPLPYERR
jgi:hypothetical protein